MKHAILAVLATFVIFSGTSFAQTSQPAQSATPVAATNAAASAETPEIHELQSVEDKWSSALNLRDQYGLELVLSPLFVNVSAAGDITSRNQQIVAVLNQEDKTAATDQRVITVRMLGDVAVANGTYSFTHKVDGKSVEERGIFTHVFQRQHGNWLCLNAQRTLVTESGAAKGKITKAKADKTKSDSKAELPFHIPLFTKDKTDQ